MRGMIQTTDRFTRSPDILHRKIKEEFILLPLRSKKETARQLYFFEGVGERIWELLDGNRECQKIVEEIASEFGVKSDRIEKEICDFLNDLVKKGLIRRYP